MKRIYKTSLSFVLTFVALNFALTLRPVQRAILSINRLDYFYTGHDWRLKLAAITHSRAKAESVAIGTSRTVLLLDPSVMKGKNDFRNLGLIAASYEQISLVARKLSQTGKRFPVIFIEVNPLALSERFIRHTGRADYNSIFTTPDPFLESAAGSFLLLHFPALRYRTILSDTLKQAFTYRAPIERELAEKKRSFHFNQFVALDRDQLLGFLPSPAVTDPELRSHLLRGCEETSNWALSKFNARRGLKYLKETVEILSKRADKIVLWIPPASSEWHNPLIASTRDIVIDEVKNWGLPLFDLSRDNPEKEWFNDCIHASEKGARHYSELLKKEFVGLYGKRESL